MREPISQKTIERPPALAGVEIHRGWASPGVDGHRSFAHFAVSANHGTVAYRYRGKLYERTGAHMVLGEAGEFIACDVKTEVRFRHWWIPSETMRQAAEDRGQAPALRFDQEAIGHTGALRPIMRSITLLDRAREPLELEEGLARLIDTLLGAYVHRGYVIGDVIAHRAVRRMRDLINEAVHETLTLDEIAAHARLNKFYALRAFKREMGVTPFAYQRHLRISKAREMLRAGQRGAQIAHALGFYDHSHFVRAFEGATLVTPRRYQLAV